MKPLCDDTKATVANKSARGHADLMVPSALKAALGAEGTRFAVFGHKSGRGEVGEQKSVSNVDIKLTDGH